MDFFSQTFPDLVLLFQKLGNYPKHFLVYSILLCYRNFEGGNISLKKNVL